MKFTKLHLYMICLLSVTWSTHSIADWCEYEIEKEEDSPCQTGWGFPEQVHEYCDKAESKIRRACFTENPNKFDMEGALDKIVAHIQYQGGLKVGPERTEVVLKNAELSILNSLIKERSSTLLQLKSDASTTMKAVKTNSEGLGKQYETTLSTYIQQVNGTEDLNTLFKLKQAISNKNIEILGLVAAEHKKLVDANMAIEQAETMLIEAYAKLPEDTLSTLKLSDIRSGTGLLSTAIQWQIDLQYQMVSLTESIQSAVDQKMTIVRIKQREKNINDATKERLATAKRIALQSQHLSEIQGIIQQMTRGKKSSYLNMTYLGGIVASAKQLKSVQEFCASPAIQPWQQQGCTRANQYKTNVTRALGTTTKASVSFATRAFSQSTDAEIISLNEHLKSILLTDDLEGAVMVHDVILEKLEASNG